MQAANSQHESLQLALEKMRAALQILDEADAPADVGAHLDLAICRLELLVEAARKAA